MNNSKAPTLFIDEQRGGHDVVPGRVATELPNHITHADAKHGVQQLYDKAEGTPGDVAEIIGFILSRPRRLAINEILLRRSLPQRRCGWRRLWVPLRSSGSTASLHSTFTERPTTRKNSGG
jgi:hypothetical protein